MASYLYLLCSFEAENVVRVWELRERKKNDGGEEQEGERESGFDEEGCVGLPWHQSQRSWSSSWVIGQGCLYSAYQCYFSWPRSSLQLNCCNTMLAHKKNNFWITRSRRVHTRQRFWMNRTHRMSQLQNRNTNISESFQDFCFFYNLY